MSKRVADRQLTDQNWEEEEESEEPGVFVAAKDDVLKGRQIKKAKRRGVAGTGEAGESAGAFKGFAGFGAAPKAAAPPFSFGATANKPNELVEGIAASSDKPLLEFRSSAADKPLGVTSQNPLGASPKPLFSFGLAKPQSNGADTKTTPSFSLATTTKPADESKSLANGPKEQNKSKYLSQLKSLNESVTKWIKDHVEKNACCILTPIFKDYEKHLAEIEKLNPDGKTGGSDVTQTPTFTQKADVPNAQVASSGGFKVSSEPTTTSAPSGGPVFNLGTTSSSSSSSIFGGSTTGFTFKSSDKPAAATTAGFSFAVNKPAGSNTAAQAEEEEYEPPKAEVTEVQEEDAVYTKRCKLFYQKDGAWVERGVGNLHIKPCNGKTQLVMRADTSLGNILLNIMLNASIPLKRQGKNNVSMICIPNPPLDPKMDEKKPASMLIRVKTSEDADKLLEELEKHKSE